MENLYMDYALSYIDKKGNPYSVKHTKPHVTTYYSYAMLAWQIIAHCCGQSSEKLVITDESAVKDDGKYLSALMIAHFQDFAKAHPPVKHMLKAYAKGTIDSFGDKDNPAFHVTSTMEGKVMYYAGAGAPVWEPNFKPTDNKTYFEEYKQELSALYPQYDEGAIQAKKLSDLKKKELLSKVKAADSPMKHIKPKSHSQPFKDLVEKKKLKTALAEAIINAGNYELITTVNGGVVVKADDVAVAFESLWDAKTFLNSVFDDTDIEFGFDLGSKNNYKDPGVDKLPGIESLVKHPVDGTMSTVMNTIINLNDIHKWSREKIADWLETLDIDLRFK